MKEAVAVLVLVLVSPSLGATCPCIEGGKWTYKGRDYLYCNNPNKARTSWCPTSLNSDGSYTPDLGMAFCEGEVLTECERLKKEVQATEECPCVEGGDWNYNKEPQSYCADPSGTGKEWCPTRVDKAGNYLDYTWCKESVKVACQAKKEALPPAECPCLPGGQWTFDGENQSYCQRPKKRGRARWCPTSESNVTLQNFRDVDFKYCDSARVLEACKKLEGTMVPTRCPCVDGGKWSHKGKDYTYCNEKDWCAKEVDEAGKYIPGTRARCKDDNKKACDDLYKVSTPEGQTQLYADYTDTTKTCPCFFDLTRNDCACCKNDGVQCGAPMEKYCTAKSLGRQAGCLGVPSHHWTLSNTGYPCFFDTKRTDCGWCATGGAQCGPGPRQGHCYNPDDPSYCNSTPGDCLHINKCDSQATCVFDVKFGKHREHYSCVCNDGWVGNGIQCFDADGNPSVEVEGGSGSTDVSLTLAVSSKYYVYPHNSSQFPAVQGEEDLINNITTLFENGATCANREGCNGTFINMAETPADN